MKFFFFFFLNFFQFLCVQELQLFLFFLCSRLTFWPPWVCCTLGSHLWPPIIHIAQCILAPDYTVTSSFPGTHLQGPIQPILDLPPSPLLIKASFSLHFTSNSMLPLLSSLLSKSPPFTHAFFDYHLLFMLLTNYNHISL